jgi:cell division protein FtsW (lipid II flippase)
VDRVTIFCILILFAIGILLGFAASTPLAQRNGLDPFYYVTRQLAFGSVALVSMLLVSMLSPVTLLFHLELVELRLPFRKRQPMMQVAKSPALQMEPDISCL